MRRKRKGREINSGDLSGSEEGGWTREQHSALKRAYAIAQPGPTFWREIAQQVPGKTAKECFNEVYSAHPTPPVPQPRPRRFCTEVKGMDSRGASAETILVGRGRPAGGKHVLLQASRAIRELLRKQQSADKEYENDAFAELENIEPSSISHDETSFGPSGGKEVSSRPYSRTAVLPCTVPCVEFGQYSTAGKGKDKFLRRDQSITERTPLGEVGGRVREIVARGGVYASSSPEVLRKVKDHRQLDKYLDLIHLRQKMPGKKTLAGVSRQSEPTLANIGAAKAAVMEGAKEILCSGLSEGPTSFQEEEEEEIEGDSL